MSNTVPSLPMDRRNFLRTSSTAAIGFALLAAIPQRLAAASANNPFNPLLGVGYADALPPFGSSVRLTDASRVLTPDPTFISRRARVKIAGMHRGDDYRGTAGGLAVDALFPILGRTPANYPRFRFWCLSGRESLDVLSAPVAFTIAVPATSGINFIARRLKPGNVAEATTPPALETDSGAFTLSLGNVAGPKLQRGVYTIALGESPSDRLTDWGAFTLAGQQYDWNIPGAPFAYLILKIDYAS